jgi:hypothetical protein
MFQPRNLPVRGWEALHLLSDVADVESFVIEINPEFD